MMRGGSILPGAFTLPLVLLVLLVACGTPAVLTGGGEQLPVAGASVSAGSTAGAAATTAPTAFPRTNNPRDVILATTTSTQDSGLLDLLVARFQEQSGYNVKTIAVGSGAAIALGQRGESDIVLAHAPESERKFVEGGAGIDRQLVMYNDFVMVGPADDPANVRGQADVLAALRAIAEAGVPFVSRGDNSGTDQLEKKLWKRVHITPSGQGWYVEAGSGMGQTLQIADQRGAYTIGDRATFLAFKDKLALSLAVEGDPRLLNIYHVILVNPQRFTQVNQAGARAFASFLLSPAAQQLIGSFGAEKFGQPLFTPCAHNSCQLADPDG